MGYRLDEPVFIAVSKPVLTEFGIHLRLESCGSCYGVANINVSLHDSADPGVAMNTEVEVVTASSSALSKGSCSSRSPRFCSSPVQNFQILRYIMCFDISYLSSFLLMKSV